MILRLDGEGATLTKIEDRRFRLLRSPGEETMCVQAQVVGTGDRYRCVSVGRSSGRFCPAAAVIVLSFTVIPL